MACYIYYSKFSISVLGHDMCPIAGPVAFAVFIPPAPGPHSWLVEMRLRKVRPHIAQTANQAAGKRRRSVLQPANARGSAFAPDCDAASVGGGSPPAPRSKRTPHVWLRCLGQRSPKTVWKMWQTCQRYDPELHQRSMPKYGSWAIGAMHTETPSLTTAET